MIDQDERQARLIRKESVATIINCAALLSALSHHYAAMQRLEEAWEILMHSEEAVPLPHNHRQRVAPREQLKQCIASSVAAEWYVADQIDSYNDCSLCNLPCQLAVLLSTPM